MCRSSILYCRVTMVAVMVEVVVVARCRRNGNDAWGLTLTNDDESGGGGRRAAGGGGGAVTTGLYTWYVCTLTGMDCWLRLSTYSRYRILYSRYHGKVQWYRTVPYVLVYCVITGTILLHVRVLQTCGVRSRLLCSRERRTEGNGKRIKKTEKSDLGLQVLFAPFFFSG